MSALTPEQEIDRIAWIIHRAYGCGPIVTPDGPGEDCRPDDQDHAAAVAVAALIAEAVDQARAEERERIAAAILTLREPSPTRGAPGPIERACYHLAARIARSQP